MRREPLGLCCSKKVAFRGRMAADMTGGERERDGDGVTREGRGGVQVAWSAGGRDGVDRSGSQREEGTTAAAANRHR